MHMYAEFGNLLPYEDLFVYHKKIMYSIYLPNFIKKKVSFYPYIQKQITYKN